MMLYRAAVGASVLSFGYPNDWVTYQSNPGKFVTMVGFCGFVVGLSVIATVAIVIGWQRARAKESRMRNAPFMDEAIRIDINCR
jgi:hypothetical protein